MFEEGLLIAFAKNGMLIFIILFEIEMRWAALIDDALDVLAVDLADVGQHCRKYSFCIPALANILSLEISNDHACV
jgi:hypothetical protein